MSDYFPQASFYFSVEIDGASYSFQEVSGLEMNIAVETQGEGSAEEKVPGKRSYGNLTLKRGYMRIGQYKTLFDWCDKTFHSDEGSQVEPKDIEIFLLDQDGDPALAWKATKAWPIKWGFSSLNASKSEILVESIEFTFDELKFIYK